MALMSEDTPPNPNVSELTERPSGFRMAVNPPVFFTSAVLILAFALAAVLAPKRAERIFTHVQEFLVQNFGWFYILAVAGFLVFVIFLMLSRHGNIKLGPDDSEPEYSYLSWFAMLFSAGMGIGLVFFGVAEPIQHFASPPSGEPGSIDAARRALVLTFFHWGVHAWAVYIVVGLALAYFSFRRGLPLTIRSALFPLIGRKINGPIGDAIDIFAVLGTMFGVATSLGLGVLQVNAGFSYLFGLPIDTAVQLVLIAVITALATLSVVLGLDKGVKRLSELNIIMAVLLLGFVLFAGSTVFLLQAYVQNIGAYLGALVSRTFRMYAYEPNPWLADWTLFYWGWWIAWSPFVGMFIARISRGRTIREFVGGVLLVPALFTFLWMTVFGNTAISLDMSGVAPIAETVKNNMPVALFETLQALPFGMITSFIATILIVTFFVTSADSGALVIDMITSGAAENPPVWQRVFWAVCAGGIAAALLVAGGLDALQTAAIASALPFAIIMVFMCYGLLKALNGEREGESSDLSASLTPAAPRAEINWQQRLGHIAGVFHQAEIDAFLTDTVSPALDAVADEMRDNGLVPELDADKGHVRLTVAHGDRGDFVYQVRSRPYLKPSFVWAETRKSHDSERRHFRAMAQASDASAPHDVTGFSRAQVIDDLLTRYGRFRHLRRIS